MTDAGTPAPANDWQSSGGSVAGQRVARVTSSGTSATSFDTDAGVPPMRYRAALGLQDWLGLGAMLVITVSAFAFLAWKNDDRISRLEDRVDRGFEQMNRSLTDIRVDLARQPVPAPAKPSGP